MFECVFFDFAKLLSFSEKNEKKIWELVFQTPPSKLPKGVSGRR